MIKKAFFLAIVVFLVACSAEKATEQTGIKISQATRNENNEVVHNIFNFDSDSKNVSVTTICLDALGNVVSDDDTFEMILEPESVSGWKPDCPEDTANYRIDIKEHSTEK